MIRELVIADPALFRRVYEAIGLEIPSDRTITQLIISLVDGEPVTIEEIAVPLMAVRAN